MSTRNYPYQYELSVKRFQRRILTHKNVQRADVAWMILMMLGAFVAGMFF